MGKKRNGPDKFYQGKGVKSIAVRTPLTGAPNTNLDFYEINTGKFRGRRKFDKNGNAEKDLDIKHKGHKNGDHVHRYVGQIRCSPEELNKKEKREIKKAKKKRRLLRK